MTDVAVPPAGADLGGLKAAAEQCHGCELWEPATQTVFGRGPADARMVLVGEQPGDVEDRQGAPFVGPAGRLLVEAIEAAGIDKTSGRRIHQTPDLSHLTACRPWLAAELNVIRPELVVLLGASAAKTLLGPDFRVTRQRGQVMPGPAGSGARMLATLHPSAVLRTPPEARDEAFEGLVADLRVAHEALT